jgi:hypothetical protein
MIAASRRFAGYSLTTRDPQEAFGEKEIIEHHIM